MGKFIKVRPTRTDSHGNGYYRGSDGKFYYGNAKNGYVTETEEEARKRTLEELQERQAEQERQAKLGELYYYRATQEPTSISSGDIVGSVAIAMVVSLALVYCVLMIAFAYSIVALWPSYIKEVFWSYAAIFLDYGRIRLVAALLYTVHWAGAAGLFAYCFLAAGRRKIVFLNPSIFFTVAFTAFSVVIFIKMSSVDVIFSMSSGVFSNIWKGLGFAMLPALILHYREYQPSGPVDFIKHMAKAICGKMPGHGVTFKVLGVILTLFAAFFAVMLVLSRLLPGPENDINIIDTMVIVVPTGLVAAASFYISSFD